MGESIKSAPNSMSSQLHPAKPCGGNLLPYPRRDFERVRPQSSPDQPTLSQQQAPMSHASPATTAQPVQRAGQHSAPRSNDSDAQLASLEPPGSPTTG